MLAAVADEKKTPETNGVMSENEASDLTHELSPEVEVTKDATLTEEASEESEDTQKPTQDAAPPAKKPLNKISMLYRQGCWNPTEP